MHVYHIQSVYGVCTVDALMHTATITVFTVIIHIVCIRCVLGVGGCIWTWVSDQVSVVAGVVE